MTLDRISAFLGLVVIGGLLLVAARIEPHQLTPFLVFLTAMAWVCFGVLMWAAFGGRRIGALTERTFVAFLLAVLGSVGCLIVLNNDRGLPFFTAEMASFLFRYTLLALLCVPTIWLVLAATNRLGADDEGQPHKRIGDRQSRFHRRREDDA